MTKSELEKYKNYLQDQTNPTDNDIKLCKFLITKRIPPDYYAKRLMSRAEELWLKRNHPEKAEQKR